MSRVVFLVPRGQPPFEIFSLRLPSGAADAPNYIIDSQLRWRQGPSYIVNPSSRVPSCVLLAFKRRETRNPWREVIT